MKRKRRSPSRPTGQRGNARRLVARRLVGRYFALAALLIIAVALLVQSLHPAERAEQADVQQVLYVIRGEATVACGEAQAASFQADERVNIANGCAVSTGPGAEAALVFEHDKVLIVLGPNAAYTQEHSERRQLGRVLHLEGALAHGKATCWIASSALSGADLRLEAGPGELFNDGGVFAAVAFDADGGRLAVYDGEVRVALGAKAATIGAEQEATLQRDGAITALASAEEAPSRPTLPADLIAAPTPTLPPMTPTVMVLPLTPVPSVAAMATATSVEAWTLYTVQVNDTLSSIAAAHGLTWQELWEANREEVSDPQLLRAGQTLRIPKSGGN